MISAEIEVPDERMTEDDTQPALTAIGERNRRNRTSPEALAKAAETRAFNAQLLREDVLSLYRRGAAPLTIATMVKRGEAYVLKLLRDAGEVVPRWLRNDLEGCALGRHDGNAVPPL